MGRGPLGEAIHEAVGEAIGGAIDLAHAYRGALDGGGCSRPSAVSAGQP